MINDYLAIKYLSFSTELKVRSSPSYITAPLKMKMLCIAIYVMYVHLLKIKLFAEFASWLDYTNTRTHTHPHQNAHYALPYKLFNELIYVGTSIGWTE